MTPINFNTIVDAEPERVQERCWAIRCTTEDGNTHRYPYTFGTKHAAQRTADDLVRTAAVGRAV